MTAETMAKFLGGRKVADGWMAPLAHPMTIANPACQPQCRRRLDADPLPLGCEQQELIAE